MAVSAGQFETTVRGRRAVGGAVVAAWLLGALSLASSSALVGAAPATNVPGAVVTVDIAAPASGPFERVRIDLGFAIPDGAVAGDQFHLTLPPQLLPIGPGFDVTDATGEVIALARTGGNVVTFTASSYVDRHDGVIGAAFLEAGWNRRLVSPGASVDLLFDADGTPFRESVALTGALPDRDRVDVWQGWADERAEDTASPTNALRWSIASPRMLGDAPSDVAIVVTPGAGSSLSCDRVTVAEATRLDAFNEFVGAVAVPAARRNVACDAGRVTVEVAGVAPGTWVLVSGRASVTDGSLDRYTNTATVTANGVTVTATGTAVPGRAGGIGGGAVRASAAVGGVSTRSATPAAPGSGPGGLAGAGSVGGVDGGTAADRGDGAGDAAATVVADDGAIATDAADLAGGGTDADVVDEAAASTADGPAGAVTPARRTGGFQVRSIAFLAAVVAAVGAVMARRARTAPR